MIAGTVFLLSILFGGGALEVFYVDKFEKGTKKYVVDKERKSDILGDIKVAKKVIKQFNKDRKKQLKAYKKLNALQSTT